MKGRKCPKCNKFLVRFYRPLAGETHFIIPPRERCSVKTKEGYKQNFKCDYQKDLI